VEIRLATEGDLDRLKPLVSWACEELEKRFGTPRADSLVYEMVKYGVQAGEAVVIALDEYNDMVGWCARVHHPSMPDGYAEGFGTWVHPNLREERIGSDMRKLADDHAKQRGVKFVHGVAAKDNVAGVKSCLAEGYEIRGYSMVKAL
jgi:predicted N-acetyltransferase YhbS